MNTCKAHIVVFWTKLASVSAATVLTQAEWPRGPAGQDQCLLRYIPQTVRDTHHPQHSPIPAVLCHIRPYPRISYFYFYCSFVYVVSCSVTFMSLWFAAYSCTIFASLWRSSPMSCASQFPVQLLWLSCLTHRKYSANILGLISTKQNNSLRIHVKSSWAISRLFPLSYTSINSAIVMQDGFAFSTGTHWKETSPDGEGIRK